MGSLAPIAEQYVASLRRESEASAKVAEAESRLLEAMSRARIKAFRHGALLLAAERGSVRATPLPTVPTSDLVEVPEPNTITPADVNGIGSVPRPVEEVVDQQLAKIREAWNPSDADLDEAAAYEARADVARD